MSNHDDFGISSAFIQGMQVGMQQRKMQQERMLAEARMILEEQRYQDLQREKTGADMEASRVMGRDLLATDKTMDEANALMKYRAKYYRHPAIKYSARDQALGGGWNETVEGGEPLVINPKRDRDERGAAQMQRMEAIRAESARVSGGSYPLQGGGMAGILEARDQYAPLADAAPRPMVGGWDVLEPAEAERLKQPDRFVAASIALHKTGQDKAQEDLMNDAMKMAELRSLYERVRMSSSSREGIADRNIKGRNDIADKNNELRLKLQELRTRMSAAHAAGASFKANAQDQATLRETGAHIAQINSGYSTQQSRLDSELATAAKTDMFASPEQQKTSLLQQASIRQRIADLEARRQEEVAPFKQDYNELSAVINARRGLKKPAPKTVKETPEEAKKRRMAEAMK